MAAENNTAETDVEASSLENVSHLNGIDRILIVGDSHANTGFMQTAIRAAAEVGAGAVIQLGDFGYWPRHKAGQVFIRKVSKTAAEHQLPVFFVDGNHEDHERLAHDNPGPTEIAPWVIYVPRGRVLTLAGVRFLFFGGAVSVDQAMRTPGADWFPSEVANYGQWERARTAGEVDVVVAHDVPEGVPLELHMRIGEALERACDQHREALYDLLTQVRPKLWLGGHYHQRVHSIIDGTRVEVFDCEYPLEQSTAVLELPSLELRPLQRPLA